VTDNSTLFDFTAELDSNTVDLLVEAVIQDSCDSPVTGAQSGPCGIGAGFSANSIEVNADGVVQSTTVGVGMYDGATTVVNAGTIEGTQQGIAIAESATVQFINNSGTIRGDEAIEVGSGARVTNGIINSGVLDGKVALGSAELNLNGPKGRVTGAVTGDIKSVVRVNGIFTTEATFDVGNMTVSSGGQLNMSHDITVNEVAGRLTNQGILAVGTGTRNLTGNYTQTSGGVFRTTVASDTEYGKLAVSGTATLAGKAEVTVANAATALTDGGTLSGVITADKIEGEFSEISTTSSIYTFNGLYRATSFGLQVVVPETEVIEDNVQRFGSPAALGAAKTLDALASDPGTMAPVIDTLDGLSEQAQSDAVEQTLPVIVAGGSMASSTSQTAFNRVLQARQAALAGMSSGEEFAGTRDVWGKAFGGWANQGDLNNVSGYSVDSGGLAFGLDRQLSPKANLGLALAYAYSSVKGNSTVAPSSVTVNSFQLGVYGDYQIKPTLQLNYQIDGAINTNSSSRDLSRFAGTPGVGSNAKGSYNSYVGHVGLGLKKFLSLGSNTRFTPELRLDYMTVQSDGYTESGGGLLDLRVSSQSYDTLYTGLDLRVDHELSNGINLMANVGAAYNALDNNVQMTSAYQGGGAAFVTDGLKVSPWLYSAGVGASGMVSDNVELNLRYDIDFSSTSYTNQMISARVKVLF
jgi:outer membrane autotransporter protein